MDRTRRILPLVGLALILVLVSGSAALRSLTVQEMPGPLSSSHETKPGANCAACHVSAGQIAPAKCLACHTEIASRIAARRGFHRDKAEDCGTCHAEHQGRDVDLTQLDPADFDHAETGADLQGAHLKVDLKSCETCHSKDRVLPRQFGRSYLLRVPGCRGCHAAPHPGRQENCLSCHSQVSWSVGRLPEGE